jgi:hypothetical protein
MVLGSRFPVGLGSGGRVWMVLGGFLIKVCLVTHTMTSSHRMSINPEIKTSYPGQARNLLFSNRFQISFFIVSIFGFTCPSKHSEGFLISNLFRISNFNPSLKTVGCG